MAVNTREEKVVLTAVDQFSKVFGDAKKSVDQMRGALEAAKSTLAAVGVTVGAGALVDLHYEALKATAALDDMAEATGASVENLSAIQRVAKVGGQDFEGLTGQIGRMVKGLKQGGEEGGKAAAAFEYLGIKTRDAQGRFRDTGQVVIELARALDQYEDNGNKVALVQDALGKGAEKYLPLLKDIAEGTDLHATVTARQAARAEEAEKNLRRLKLVMEDSRRELVNSLTPAIIEFTERLLAASKASGGLLPGLATMGSAQPAINADRIGERLKEIDRILAGKQSKGGQLFDRIGNTMTGGLYGPISGMLASDLENEREYLRAVQRQQALAGAGDQNLDARDMRLRQPKLALDYQSPDTKKQKGLTPFESAELQMRQAISKAQFGDSEAVSVQLDIQAGKYGELNEAQKSRLIQLAAERDLQKENARVQEEVNRLVERNGEQELRREEARRRELEAFRDSIKTQQQLLEEQLAAKLEALAASGAAAHEIDDIAAELYRQHEDELTKIHDDEIKKRYGISQVYRKLDADSAAAFLGYMTLLMKTKSRELFEVGKAAAIGETVINTFRAAQGAYAAMSSIPYVGPFLGAAAAAAAVAAGLANVQQIRSQSYGGGGSGATPTYSASPTTGLPTGSPSPGEGTAAAPVQTTVLKIRGEDLFTGERVRELVDSLYENKRDGGRVRVIVE